MFYSKTTGWFYSREIHGAAIPTDAVEITAEQHAALLTGQSAGQLITADESGYPVLADPPPASLDTLRDRALSQLPAWEKAERAAGIEHAGQRWLTTPSALQDFRDVLLAGAVPNEQWVTADRKIVPMTLPELQSLWQAITARGAAIYQRRLEMEQQIADMSREQLEAFRPGWSEPAQGNTIIIKVNPGVELVTASTTIKGVFDFSGSSWAGKIVVIENSGIILGRGGNGGHPGGQPVKLLEEQLHGLIGATFVELRFNRRRT